MDIHSLVKNWFTGLTIPVVKIPAGTFKMGSNNGSGDERPVHEVTIMHDYYLGETEVTNEAYRRVMGESPSPEGFDGPSQPVVRVPWDKADQFCRQIGKRLPTEAEWEKAARGGRSDCEYGTTDCAEPTDDNACWSAVTERSTTCDVEKGGKNAFGLYGMSGNVWEWVSDWYGDYPADHVVDPKGPNDGYWKVSRGSSWGDGYSVGLRAANRNSYNPDFSNDFIGFRCASSDDPSK